MFYYASLIFVVHAAMTKSFCNTASLKSIKRLASNCVVRRNKSQPTFDPNPVRWLWRSVGVPVADQLADNRTADRAADGQTVSSLQPSQLALRNIKVNMR
jgi:hypothetical protein